MVSAMMAIFCAVVKRRRRAAPAMISTLENVSDIGVCLGLSPGPPANAGVRSKRGAVQDAYQGACGFPELLKLIPCFASKIPCSTIQGIGQPEY